MAAVVRWGILSTANIGRKRVIPAIRKAYNGEVVAVASRSLERAEAFAQELDIPKAYGSYEALINAPDVDAIYIPLPNSEHSQWSLRCAAAGKPCLCEKPLALDAGEAWQMVDAFAARGVLLAEAFMYRFHPQMQQLKALVDEGAIGEVQMMSSTFGFNIAQRPDDIRWQQALGGGSLMDVGCYCINFMRFVTGEEPDAVSAQAVMGGQGVDARMVGTLHFPSGALGHFDSSFSAVPRQNSAEVRGTAGRIEIPQAFTPDAEAETHIILWRGEQRELISVPAADQYQLMVEDFAEALLQARPLRFPPADAVANMRVIDLLRAALRPH